MCSPTEITLLNDAQAARTRIEMELQTLTALLDRYDTPAPVLAALRAAQSATADVKRYQAQHYARMAGAYREKTRT